MQIITQSKFRANKILMFPLIMFFALNLLSDGSSLNENEKVILRSSLKVVRNKINGCLIQLRQQYPTMFDWMSLAFYFFTSTTFMIILFSVLLYYFLIDCED